MPLTYRLDQNEIGDADCADGHEPEADLMGNPRWIASPNIRSAHSEELTDWQVCSLVIGFGRLQGPLSS